MPVSQRLLLLNREADKTVVALALLALSVLPPNVANKADRHDERESS